MSILLSSFDPAMHRKLPGKIAKDIDVLFLGGLTERSAFGEEMTEQFNRAKIILNLHAEDHLDVETRVYEVLGCGGFLITEKLAEENPFTAGELVQIDRVEDLEQTIRRYLRDDEERERIAALGHTEALRAHSYTARAEQLVSVMQDHVGGSELRPPFEHDAPWYFFRVAEGQRRVLATIKQAVRSMRYPVCG